MYSHSHHHLHLHHLDSGFIHSLQFGNSISAFGAAAPCHHILALLVITLSFSWQRSEGSGQRQEKEAAFKWEYLFKLASSDVERTWWGHMLALWDRNGNQIRTESPLITSQWWLRLGDVCPASFFFFFPRTFQVFFVLLPAPERWKINCENLGMRSVMWQQLLKLCRHPFGMELCFKDMMRMLSPLQGNLGEWEAASEASLSINWTGKSGLWEKEWKLLARRRIIKFALFP